MLKKYATKYKKMHKRRYTHESVFTFNMWRELKETYYPRSIFIYFTRAFFIKLKFFRKFRRKFRKQCKRRRLSFLFFCKPNFLIHEKFKNARMGKGKGSPTHWIYKPNLSKPIAILTGMHVKRGHSILTYLKKHLNPYLLARRNFSFWYSN